MLKIRLTATEKTNLEKTVAIESDIDIEENNEEQEE